MHFHDRVSRPDSNLVRKERILALIELKDVSKTYDLGEVQVHALEVRRSTFNAVSMLP